MELWHALNRGVDGRDIFMEDYDRLRFVHDLYEFNDTAPADNNTGYRFKSRDIVSPYMHRERQQIVQIHGWCLMRNHYHLLLSPIVENGVSIFLRKLNVGYARSFNEKYERKGALFQSRTKRVLIESDAHFNYILHYVHLNPLDYLDGAQEWRARDRSSITNSEQALAYLSQYRWSSYLDYTGIRNFPSILTTSLFQDSSDGHKNSLRAYLEDAEYDLSGLTLE